MNLFFERYKEIVNIDGLESVKLKRSLRINTLKISENELIKRLKKRNIKLIKIPYLKNGYYYEADFSLSSVPEYLLGYYYLQEAASQLPSLILNPTLKDVVLDMAAAPGSKTGQMAALMNNKGELVALDIKNKRMKALHNNMNRLGVEICVMINKDAKYCSDLNLKFDKVLLDAPCSGNFVTDPNWFKKRRIDDFQKKSEDQKKLLKEGIKVLKSNGILVYSTCSLEPEENEEVVDWAIKNLNVSVETIDLNIGDKGILKFKGKQYDEKVSNCLRLWPHKTNTQGFFIAKLRKL